MRKFVIFAVLSVFAISMQAQKAGLSPRTAMTLNQIEKGQCQKESIHAFATLKAGVDLKALDAYGVRVNSVVGNMMTVVIPSKSFADFAASGLCTYIDVAHKAYPFLDKARTDMGVDYIHRGVNLPQGYDGSGVVVGVIDHGFEYGHPSFYDSTGTTLRIKRVWQQSDSTGTAPTGFSYGGEYATQADILAVGTDDPRNGHGSHTTGIAAGCGAPNGNGSTYCGMAPAADIVLVSSNMTYSGIFDGIRYIHQYARSMGKPCVVNISLGSVMGPHDGTDEFDVMLNNYLLATPMDSIVVVVSAGNSGDTWNHLHKSFTATDTVVRTFFRDLILGDYDVYVDCWGDVGDDFSVSLSLYDLDGDYDTQVLHAELPFVSSTVDSTYNFQLVSARDSVYNCVFSVVHSSPRNGRPEIFIEIYKSGSRASIDCFMLTIKSTSANVHVWSDKEEFYNRWDTNYVHGDYDYLIGGVGANTDAVISVGSYATRTKEIDGSTITQTLEGDLSPFSSHGPTYDGRVKPDICAPGEMLVSSINTPYLSEYPDQYLYDSTLFNGQMHYYVLMQGTSMSSPVMAGIVALWMQNNPGLNVDSVRTLLHSTALHDVFTGDIPSTGSNLWGWGKVDAFAGLPATTVPMYRLDVSPDNYLNGYVTGSGRHPQGAHLIEAFSRDGLVFTQWSDGSTDNPRILNLTSDTTIIALFDYAPCDTIRQFPWTAVINDASLNCWESYGTGSWLCYDGGITSMGSSRVNNWLITPNILAAPQTALIYTCSSLHNDSMAVVVITNDIDTTVLSDELYGDPVEQHIDLTPYAGQIVRFGFYHHTRSVGVLQLLSIGIDYVLGIDDVEHQSYKVATSGLHFTVMGAPEGQLDVYDIMGRRVLSSPVANGTFSLPTAGVYLLHVGNLPVSKIVLVK